MDVRFDDQPGIVGRSILAQLAVLLLWLLWFGAHGGALVSVPLGGKGGGTGLRVGRGIVGLRRHV